MAANSETSLSIRLPANVHAQLVELARRNDRTVSAEARIALRRYLDLQPKEEGAAK